VTPPGGVFFSAAFPCRAATILPIFNVKNAGVPCTFNLFLLENLVKTFNDYKTVTEAEAKRVDLQHKLQAAEKRFSDLQSGHTARQAGSVLQQKAAALLTGDASPIENQGKVSAALEELAVLREAESMQRKKVAAAKSAASNEIAQSCLPEYKALVSRQAKALRALAEVMKDEIAFRERLVNADVEFTGTIPPMSFQPVPNLDVLERIEAWMKEAKSRGYSVRIAE
jgi:hypothetical protein